MGGEGEEIPSQASARNSLVGPQFLLKAGSTQEKMLRITNYLRNVSQNTVTCPSHQSEWPSLKSLQITNTGEGMEKSEPSYTVSGNVNWCSHYGEQCGDCLNG